MQTGIVFERHNVSGEFFRHKIGKAIEAKASNSELKAKLAEFKAARQKKQAELEKAQDELRQVLTVRQEAVAATFGIL